MRIDLAGQVNAIHLPGNKALLPLFEAIVNAIQAIDERSRGHGLIEVTINRHGLAFPDTGADSQLLPDISGFEIVDNGVGFTDKHFTSFDTSYSTLKASIGGKGIGRLVWLKAFERATIDSVYEEQGVWKRRQFRFVPTTRGIDGTSESVASEPQTDHRTSVRLEGFKDPYRSLAPKGASTIALRIVEHCLVLYMIDAMPRIVIVDPSMALTVDLTDVYKNEVNFSKSTRIFSVGGHEFSIMDAMLRASAATENAIHFCANKREVEGRKLTDLIAHAENPIKLDGVELRYAACVTGPYLDARVNQERTGFNVDHADNLALYGETVTWEQIVKSAVSAAAEFLTPQLAEAKERAVQRLEKFITEKEPRYRILLEHRRSEVERIPGALTDEKLELELHSVLASWRHAVKVEAARKLTESPGDADSLDQYERDAASVLESLGEVVKSELTEYVYHRRLVLDFMAQMLGLMASGKFAKEDILHGLFFPTRTTSDLVDYDKHNLWVLDERLAFHKFLASDVAFSHQVSSPVRVTGQDRPDILIYNHPIAFAENLEETNSVVIVEFKKPERDDYSDTDNPLDQVLEYVEQVNAGKAIRADGSSVLAPREGTPFFCHVIATLTPKLRALAKKRGFHPTPDGQGFFDFNENYRAYIEVVDYRKVHSDAVKRNSAFFDKLGLHTGAQPPPK